MRKIYAHNRILFQVRNLVTSAQVQEHEYAGTHIISSSLLRTSLELTKFIGGDFEYPGKFINN